MTHWKSYITIARPSHWTKHVFIIPGIVVAIYLTQSRPEALVILTGFISACLIASANYVINELLDAEFDRHHPVKKSRPAVSNQLKPSIVYAEYVILALLGLVIAWSISNLYFIVSFVFFVSGVIYNIRPLRLKERPYFDVICESFNNPIRLTLGWVMISPSTIPPLSLIIIFWFAGAFLMSVKRLGEYRFIVNETNHETAALYRASFAKYTEKSLLISCFSYSFFSAFSIATFLIKYREEYVLTVPLLALLFSYYLNIGLKNETVALNPEKMHHDPILITIALALSGALVLLTLHDIEIVNVIVQSKFLPINEN